MKKILVFILLFALGTGLIAKNYKKSRRYKSGIKRTKITRKIHKKQTIIDDISVFIAGRKGTFERRLILGLFYWGVSFRSEYLKKTELKAFRKRFNLSKKTAFPIVIVNGKLISRPNIYVLKRRYQIAKKTFVAMIPKGAREFNLQLKSLVKRGENLVYTFHRSPTQKELYFFPAKEFRKSILKIGSSKTRFYRIYFRVLPTDSPAKKLKKYTKKSLENVKTLSEKRFYCQIFSIR